MIAAILTTIVPALLPAVSDILRSVGLRITGGAEVKPLTIKDKLDVMEAENRRLEMLAKLDTAGIERVSRWVADVRAMMRPTIGMSAVAGYVGLLYFGETEAAENLRPTVQAVVFYLFGERTIQHLKRGDK